MVSEIANLPLILPFSPLYSPFFGKTVSEITNLPLILPFSPLHSPFFGKTVSKNVKTALGKQ